MCRCVTAEQVCMAIAFLQWVIVPGIVPFAALFFFVARFIFGFLARYWNDTSTASDESGGRNWFFKVGHAPTPVPAHLPSPAG